MTTQYNQETGKRQVFIDASALKNSSCFRNLWWSIFEGYQGSNDKNHKLAFGSAIHIFLEDYYIGKSIKDSINRAIEYYKPYNETLDVTPREFRTVSNLIRICKAYAEEYGTAAHIWETEKAIEPLKDIDGKPLVEYKFAIPIWANEHFDLLLSGTIDLVATYHGYPCVLIDHKTTAMAMNDKFFDNYDWDIQPMLYCKVWKEANKLEEFPHFVINGVFCKKPTEKGEKSGIFDGVLFKRSSLISYSNDQMVEFDKWLCKKLHNIIANLSLISENPKFDPAIDYNMAACKTVYGDCKYFKVCSLPKENQSIKLDISFIKHHYNPLKFRD